MLQPFVIASILMSLSFCRQPNYSVSGGYGVTENVPFQEVIIYFFLSHRRHQPFLSSTKEDSTGGGLNEPIFLYFTGCFRKLNNIL